MKKQSIEFTMGVTVWLLDVPISYWLWFWGEEVDIQYSMSPLTIGFTGFLFVVYLAGLLSSHGVVTFGHKRAAVILGLLVSSAAVLGLSAFFFFGMVALLATMIIIQLAPLLEQKRGLAIAVLVPCICVLIDVTLGKEFNFTSIVVYALFNGIALLTSYRIISERNAKLQSEQLVRELKATQVLLSASTKKDERLRISRDLHDAVGHQLTALSLQLEVANHVNQDDKQKHIQQAQMISGALLANVRETVSEMRDSIDVVLRDALEALVQDIPGLTIKLDVQIDESVANADQIEVIFRCVQESLTNSIKHSNASQCWISLSEENQYLVLSIKDNGTDSANMVMGNGLKGMAERVSKLDGRLDVKNTPNGFVVWVKLPQQGQM